MKNSWLKRNLQNKTQKDFYMYAKKNVLTLIKSNWIKLKNNVIIIVVKKL